MKHKFKVGDKVRFVYPGDGGETSRLEEYDGRTGVVKRVINDICAYIEGWPEDIAYAPYLRNLRPIKEKAKFKVGDRVKFVGPVVMKGKYKRSDFGVITKNKSTLGNWTVKFDTGEEYCAYEDEHLEITTPKTKAELFLEKWKGKRISCDKWGGYWFIPDRIEGKNFYGETNSGFKCGNTERYGNGYELYLCTETGERIEEIEIGDEISGIDKRSGKKRRFFVAYSGEHFFSKPAGQGGKRIDKDTAKLIRKAKDIGKEPELTETVEMEFKGVPLSSVKWDIEFINEIKTTEDKDMNIFPICDHIEVIIDTAVKGKLFKDLKKMEAGLRARQDAINSELDEIFWREGIGSITAQKVIEIYTRMLKEEKEAEKKAK
jgi:hypothetical protein